MTNYDELLTLVAGTLSEEETQNITLALREMLEKTGAQIHKHEVWEKRKLAYPIEKVRQGTYIVSTFHLESGKVSEIERSLRLNTGILRHQLVRTEQKTAKEIEEEARRAGQSAEADRATESAGTPVKEKAEPVSKEQLDEKLAGILTDDMVK